MRCVILSNKLIPGYNVKGPVLSPMEYDPHLVMGWIINGIDVREVMEDGSHRKLNVNDARLIAEIHNKTEDVMNNRVVKEQPIEQRGHVRLIPDKKPLEPVKPKQPEPPKEEVVEKVEEQPLDLLIDELERPE